MPFEYTIHRGDDNFQNVTVKNKSAIIHRKMTKNGRKEFKNVTNTHKNDKRKR